MLKHLIENVACSKQMSQLISMDKDERQVIFGVVDLKGDITAIAFVLHHSHKMQPLNMVVSDPLKHDYKEAVGKSILGYTGKVFTIYVYTCLW